MNGKVFQIVQDHHRAARRRDLHQQLMEFGHQNCRVFLVSGRKFIQLHVVFVPRLPQAPSPQLSERGARGNAVGPCAKEFRLVKLTEVADDFQKYVLQNILSPVRAHQSANIPEEDGLHSRKQFFKRPAVSRLGEENQMRLMNTFVQEITFH